MTLKGLFVTANQRDAPQVQDVIDWARKEGVQPNEISVGRWGAMFDCSEAMQCAISYQFSRYRDVRMVEQSSQRELRFYGPWQVK